MTRYDSMIPFLMIPMFSCLDAYSLVTNKPLLTGSKRYMVYFFVVNVEEITVS